MASHDAQRRGSARGSTPAGVNGPPARGGVDASIRAALETGDQRGAATLALREYGPQVMGYLRALLRDRSAAEEAFSEFAEDVWRALPGFRGDGPLRAWVFRVAWAAARDLRGQAWRTRARRLETSAEAHLAQVVSSGARRLEERSQQLGKLRASLSAEDQCLLQLRLDQGLSLDDCALVLTTSERTVTATALAKRFERAKAKLGRLARLRGLLPSSSRRT
jgi:RNA polymerase sigma-70 factor (ECF subfamily)